jgi:CRISPR-associated protein Csy2
MHLREILFTTDIQVRNRKLKAVFQPASDGIEVDGCELHTLIILLNLTLKKDQIDYCDPLSAAATIKDKKHMKSCIDEIQWIHSHNLKYPNARVSKQCLRCASPEIHNEYITSANFQSRFGWSHDGQKIRKAILFSAEFKFEAQWTCLAALLAARNNKWLRALHWFGISVEQQQILLTKIDDVFTDTHFPSNVSPFSPQVIFPYCGKYISVTPVTSHAVQSSIQNHQMRHPGKNKFITIVQEHSPAIGNLCAATGGKVHYLFYPPINRYQKPHHLHDSKISQWKKSKSVFYEYAINNKITHLALNSIAENDAITFKKRRQKRISALRHIRRQLAQWLSPVMEWRDNLQADDRFTELSRDSLEYQLLSLDATQFIDLLNEVNIRFHQTLQNDYFGSLYAYHPQLMIPIRSQIRWLLNKLAQSEDNKIIVHDSVYIHLSKMRVYDANALPNGYLCGTPSLTAVWGMMHQFQRRLNKQLPFTVEISSFAWFIRHYSLVKGERLPEYSKLIDGKPTRPGIIAGKRCDLETDFIFSVKLPSECTLTDSYLELIQAAVPGIFAGGSQHAPSFLENKEWCQLYTNGTEAFNKVASFPANGVWITPSKRKIHDIQELIEITTFDPSVLPIIRGYAFLETPTERDDSLIDKHCYAESIIGVAQRLSGIDMRLNGKNSFLKSAFWTLASSDCSIIIKNATE